MSDGTRIVRVFGGQGPQQAGIGTLCFGSTRPPEAPASDRAVHAAVHRQLRSAVLEQPRHGLLVLAVQGTGREVGRLWLAASTEPRAATVGRHETVDLPLGQDPGLSLRHLVFLVRTVSHSVRFTALDLASVAGVSSPRAQVSRVESSRPVLLRSSGLWFFCVPTGPGATFPADQEQAFAQLSAGGSSHGRPASLPGGPSGQLLVRERARARVFDVEPHLLREGVLIGRATRCDLHLPDPYASRVHAVVVSVDGAPHLIDTGSGNGVRHVSGAMAECWPLKHGDSFLLGNSIVEWRAGGCRQPVR